MPYVKTDSQYYAAIANAIRSKNGLSTQYLPSQMAAAILAIPSGSGGGGNAVTYSQENSSVTAFIANVTYDPTDYTTSQIDTYADPTTDYEKDEPSGVTLTLPNGTLTVTDGVTGVSYSENISAGSKTIYNLAPGADSNYRVTSDDSVVAEGVLRPTGTVRMIKTDNAENVRDLGGWACDGGTVKYGLLYRGGSITSADREVLVNRVGIAHELSLLGTDTTETQSSLGSDIGFTKLNNYVWYSLLDQGGTAEAWVTILRCVFNCVHNGTPVYFHCGAGADRTGTVAYVIETLLGVSQSDCDKDYELTSMSPQKRRRNGDGNIKDLVAEINAIPGTSFKQKLINWVVGLGFTASEINDFRQRAINGNPAAVSAETILTVTQNLTNVVSNNNAQQMPSGGVYNAKILPYAGYRISSVGITMGGTNITQSAWNGVEYATRYTVSWNITNCTTTNNATNIAEGSAFTATIYPLEGYEITNVLITMGGINVSNYYTSGTITIPNVTGNIEITITATAAQVNYTNLVPTSVDTDGNVFNTTGYKNGYRIGGDSSEKAAAGCVCTGFIPVAKGDVIRFTGVDWNVEDTGSSYSGLCYLNELASNAVARAVTSSRSGNVTLTKTDGVYYYTVNHASTNYIRISAVGDGATMIVTKNEPIE